MASIDAMNVFAGVFEGTFGTLLERISENPLVWMRILFGFAIFSVLYAGASFVPALKGRIAVVISGVIAIVSIVAVPAEVYVGIGTLYGGVVASLLVVVPFAALIWITYAAISAYREHRIIYWTTWVFLYQVLVMILMESHVIQSLRILVQMSGQVLKVMQE